jgi:hypothetical protein
MIRGGAGRKTYTMIRFHRVAALWNRDRGLAAGVSSARTPSFTVDFQFADGQVARAALCSGHCGLRSGRSPIGDIASERAGEEGLLDPLQSVVGAAQPAREDARIHKESTDQNGEYNELPDGQDAPPRIRRRRQNSPVRSIAQE